MARGKSEDYVQLRVERLQRKLKQRKLVLFISEVGRERAEKEGDGPQILGAGGWREVRGEGRVRGL